MRPRTMWKVTMMNQIAQRCHRWVHKRSSVTANDVLLVVTTIKPKKRPMYSDSRAKAGRPGEWVPDIARRRIYTNIHETNLRADKEDKPVYSCFLSQPEEIKGEYSLTHDIRAICSSQPKLCTSSVSSWRLAVYLLSGPGSAPAMSLEASITAEGFWTRSNRLGMVVSRFSAHLDS